MKPNLRTARASLFLLAGLAVLGLAGCSKSAPTAAEVRAEWMEKTRRAIPDPVRAGQTSEIVGRLLDAHEARAAALREASDRLTALNADYHTTQEQLLTVYHDYENRQREAATRFRDDLLALRRQVSPAEWEAIVD